MFALKPANLKAPKRSPKLYIRPSPSRGYWQVWLACINICAHSQTDAKKIASIKPAVDRFTTNINAEKMMCALVPTDPAR